MRYREVIPCPLLGRHIARLRRPLSEVISSSSKVSPVRILPKPNAPRRSFDVRGFTSLSTSFLEEARP